MAFKSYQSTGVSTEAVVFTGAVGKETTVIGMSVANVGSTASYVSVKLNSAYVVKDAPVAVGGALVAIGGSQKVVVEANDTISVSCTGSTCDVIISTLEV